MAACNVDFYMSHRICVRALAPPGCAVRHEHLFYLWAERPFGDAHVHDHELIRTGEATSILGSSRQHVVDLCDRGLLTCERSPEQRRLRRSEVEAFASRVGSSLRLNREQRRSLWLHGAVAGHLAVDPVGTLEHARTNLGRLRVAHPTDMSARWLDTWQAVLASGPEAVLQTLTAQTPLAIELRQNSPFAGVLPDEVRAGVIGAFRDLDRRVPA